MTLSSPHPLTKIELSCENATCISYLYFNIDLSHELNMANNNTVVPDYARFFDLGVDMFCIANMEGFFVEVNQAFMRTLGYTRDELLSSPFVDFVHPADVESTLGELSANKSGKQTLHFQNRYKCKDGSWKIIAWQAIPDSEGLIFASARDITEEKNKEDIVRRSIIGAQDTERQRIAKEIHDGVCQSLVAIQLNFHLLEPEEDNKKAYYQTANKLIKNSIREMRAYAHNLQPPELAAESITEAITNLCSRTEILSDIEINFECQCSTGFELRLDLEQKTHIYRIVQEFINNSLKHSNCTMISMVCALKTDHLLELSLSDNGKGLAQDINSSMKLGSGLANILTRIQLIHGKFKFKTKSSGFNITVSVPMAPLVSENL